MAAQGARTPEQIRASIEDNRRELGLAIERLQSEVHELTDWRKKVAQNQKQILIGAAIAGFVLGGGIAGVTGLFRRR
jgi:3-dehydroquinate dehydratase